MPRPQENTFPPDRASQSATLRLMPRSSEPKPIAPDIGCAASPRSKRLTTGLSTAITDGRANRRTCGRASFAVIGLCVALVVACGGSNTASPVDAPGAAKEATTRALEVGAAALQSKPPLEAINAYLDGFHFYNGRMDTQMEAHHYCAVLNEELIQCVIYDGNVKDAKLMGVEYIVSERLFKTLPRDEQALWHSHVYEVKSGALIAPGIPEVAERELMRKLVGTYGKTFHTWHTDLHKELPIGVPQVMMGFTSDGQADAAMIADRDRRFGTTSAEKRRQRGDIPSPAIADGADAWQKGRTIQLADPSANAHTHK